MLSVAIPWGKGGERCKALYFGKDNGVPIYFKEYNGERYACGKITLPNGRDALNSRGMVAESQVGRGSLTVMRLPRQRVDQFLAEFYDIAEVCEDVKEIHDCIRRGMKATITIRAPDENSRNGWSYAWVPDSAVQIAACRLLGEILGLMPKSGAVNVNVQDNSIRITIDQQLAEVCNLDPVAGAELANELRQAADKLSLPQPNPDSDKGDHPSFG